ncbi:hypothetical protein DUI87_14154 [Hirundo rustica rustica]|uniref:Craniofacial development protein 1 n=1 Tax=Hirundo rustica rustica TaxID=333673 RepID=A0A3M0KQ28_HIRRU|nr:hypothetical protein DUI87_14154 [Hirundo rustica rustica]
MSASESEQEQYSSAEDDDYVPSGAEYSEDDESELVREEEPADSPRPPRGRRSPRRRASRKRKKGGLLLEPDEKEEEKAQQNGEEEEEDNVEQIERSREEEEKKKEDALWASFLSDVGQKPKAAAATQVTQIKKAEEENNGNKPQEKPKDSGKVTITKTFDFAGEEIKVTKEVDSNSKEAKSFLKQQEKLQSAAPGSLPTVSGAPNPDAAQPQMPSLSPPPAVHPGFVQWSYGRGAAVVFGSMCGTAQLFWDFSRRFSGAIWPVWALRSESAPGSLGLVSKIDPETAIKSLPLGFRRCFQLESQPGYFQFRAMFACLITTCPSTMMDDEYPSAKPCVKRLNN